jgi:hypothetical protein
VVWWCAPLLCEQVDHRIARRLTVEQFVAELFARVQGLSYRSRTQATGLISPAVMHHPPHLPMPPKNPQKWLRHRAVGLSDRMARPEPPGAQQPVRRKSSVGASAQIFEEFIAIRWQLNAFGTKLAILAS